MDENLQCSYAIIRKLLNENEIGKIGHGKIKILNGNISFVQETWQTGDNSPANLLKEFADLKIASDGRIIGTTPLYTMFGNDRQHIAIFEKDFKRKNQSLKPEGINATTINENLQISITIKNCRN